MLVATTQAEELLGTVKEEMRHILGPVGARPENVQWVSSAGSDWNCAAVACREFSNNEDHAFRVVSSHLLPFRKHPLQPVGAAFRR
eukprot:7502075-Lingulodinium_polyedra.AAC.1